MAYIDVNAIIENTSMKASYRENGTLIDYRIYPNEGYLLHDKFTDFEVYDERGMPTGEIKQGFIPYPSFLSVWGNYNWETNPLELFTVPQGTIPEDQIFGFIQPPHETI